MPYRTGKLPLALGAVLVLSMLAPTLLPDRGRRIDVSDVRPAQGLSFVGKLGDPELGDDRKPTGANLYLIESRRGTALHYLDDWCAAKFACSWLNALVDSNWPNATYEVRRQLGPAGAQRRDIEEMGNGLYSVWSGAVYFGLPHDVSSILNVKRVEVEIPSRRRELVFVWLQYLSAGGLVVWAIVALTGWRRLRFVYRDVLPGLLITAVSLAAIFAGAELYFRYAQMFPADEIRFPRVFVDQLGFTIEPGATVKWTNGIDFWVTDKANSLGFLDAEPVLPKPAGTFRVVLVGDSFVEAAQVPLSQKLQTLLAADLKQKFPGRSFDAVALGLSGSGQSNQLRYYERNRKELKPDVVVLLFVSNDFANNSRLLESLRQGWHPDHAPWLFMKAANACERLPIVSDWQKSLLSGASVAQRAGQLRETSREIDASLGSWNPETIDIDAMFWKPSPLPPAFEEAVASTKCAFAEWKKLAEEDGFRLVVAAAENVGARGNGQIDRLKSILGDLSVPLIDLYPAFGRQKNPASARWKVDAHWAPNGHRWAADEILKYLVAHDYVKQN